MNNQVIIKLTSVTLAASFIVTWVSALVPCLSVFALGEY